MTRSECETRIAEHMEAIIEIAKQYNPATNYIQACYLNDKTGETYSVNNAHFEHGNPDEKLPIDFRKRIKRSWNDVRIEFDCASTSFTVSVNGKVEFEHLAKDEVTEVVRNLMP